MVPSPRSKSYDWRGVTLKKSSSSRVLKTQPGEFRNDRASWLFGIFSTIFFLITCRAIMLHLFPSAGESLHNIADNQYQKEIELAPYRGPIYDRNGEPLAISIRRPSFAINPRAFHPSTDDMRDLARILRMPFDHVKKTSEKDSYFAWLARQIEPRMADEITKLGLNGLTQITGPARFYPAGSAAAHIIGFTGLDNSGLAGIERQFDKDLRGQPLRVLTSKDARGKFIFNESEAAAPSKVGSSIYLTIDRVIQEITEDELEAGVRKARAERGFAIVTDPHTGRILAIANYPSFDPNNARSVNIGDTTNHALVDTFEPGSVVKPFVIGAALEQKKTRLDEIFDVEGGVIKIGKFRIHDSHASHTLSTTDILVRSSNIGAYKIASRLGRQKTFEALSSYGFSSKKSALGFPGEANGHISPWNTWADVRFANVAFGHGFIVTGMELVQAMAAIANGGNVMKPTLIDRIVAADGVVLMSSMTEDFGRAAKTETARLLRGVLRQVVEDPHGTASKAKTKNYSTAGKTGTAQKVEPGVHGYAKDKYIASFLGFSPVEDPHLVIYVEIDEPREKPFYGGIWAAPVFSGIAERSLKYLNVAPDIDRDVDTTKGSGKPVAARTPVRRLKSGGRALKVHHS